MLRHRRDEPIDQALRAIMDDDERTLRKLIHDGLLVDATDHSGAPLIFFCVEGRLRCLALLLSMGVNPAQPCPDGSTPAMRAARTCADSFALLCTAREPWSDADKDGNNVLHQGSMAQSRLGLMALGAAVERAPLATLHALNQRGMSPLASACRIDNADALCVLLPRSDALATNPVSGLTPLAYCVEFDKPRCARILWRHPGSVGPAGADGIPTLLHRALLLCDTRATPWPWLSDEFASAERLALHHETDSGTDRGSNGRL